jgi:hypothetical protein
MEDFPRLKSHIRVAALLRRVGVEGAFATVARRGDADAGAIAVKVFIGAGQAQLFVESRNEQGARFWRDQFDGACEEARVDAYLAKEAAFDSDVWIIEIEDRDRRVRFDDL